MSVYYKAIDWNFNPLIDMDLTRFTNQSIQNLPFSDVNPLVFDTLDKAGLKLLIVQSFYSAPGHIWTAHIDGTPALPWTSRCKINWVDKPVASNQWFTVEEIDKENIIASRISETNTYYADLTDVPKTVAETAYLQGWHLFEAGFPHQIFNRSDEPRWCLAFTICPIEENGWTTMETISSKLKI